MSAPKRLTPTQRLDRIASIIENVDLRCTAGDGPVIPTLHEMTQRELSYIYRLAVGNSRRFPTARD